MSNTPKERPAPMTSQEYARRYADACVKADVVPGPGWPCDEVVEVRRASEASMETAGGDAVREAPV